MNPTFLVTIQDSHTALIRISNTSCSFPPLTRLKMLIRGWGALLGPLCRKQSLLRASTTIHCFCTAVLNSYNKKYITIL